MVGKRLLRRLAFDFVIPADSYGTIWAEPAWNTSLFRWQREVMGRVWSMSGIESSLGHSETRSSHLADVSQSSKAEYQSYLSLVAMPLVSTLPRVISLFHDMSTADLQDETDRRSEQAVGEPRATHSVKTKTTATIFMSTCRALRRQTRASKRGCKVSTHDGPYCSPASICISWRQPDLTASTVDFPSRRHHANGTPRMSCETWSYGLQGTWLRDKHLILNAGRGYWTDSTDCSSVHPAAWPRPESGNSRGPGNRTPISSRLSQREVPEMVRTEG
jgi:hypothetical protein